MELTAKNVEAIMRASLLTGEETKACGLPDAVIGNKLPEAPEGVILSHGALTIYGFNEARLKSHREDIKSLLSQLHPNFHISGKGGWSLINAVETKDGTLWGEQLHADALFCLGQALKLCKYCFSRDMWKILPGAMPYIVINLDGFKTMEPWSGSK